MFKKEVDWLIHYKCNYRCSYCFFDGMWEEVESKNRYLPVSEIIAAWKRVAEKYGDLNLIITGGEPFEYPGFNLMLKELTSFLHVSFDTNLSCNIETVKKIAETVPPSRLFMGLSYHPEFCRRDAFKKKADIIKNAGIDCRIHFVTYPPHLNKLFECRDFFQKNGFRFTPIPFRGEFKGRSYPGAFNEEERQKIYNATRRTCEKDRKWADSQVKQVISKGKLCRAGQDYVRVDCDGSVYRCANDFTMGKNNDSLGNIFNGTFSFSEKPLICRQKNCPCEFRWIVN